MELEMNIVCMKMSTYWSRLRILELWAEALELPHEKMVDTVRDAMRTRQAIALYRKEPGFNNRGGWVPPRLRSSSRSGKRSPAPNDSTSPSQLLIDRGYFERNTSPKGYSYIIIPN
jgi:hypothetical protein